MLDGRQGILDDALGFAARSDQLETLEMLLDAGAQVDARGYVGTALHWAAFFGRLGAVRALLGRGADPEVPDDNESIGGPPLGWARVFEHSEVADLLIDARRSRPV